MIWAISNLPAEEHGAISAILLHLQHGLALAAQSHPNVTNQDLVSDLRDDLGNALNGRAVSLELAALADTICRYRIPRQYLFEFVDGVDWLMRFPPPPTAEDLMDVATRVGGSVMAAAIQVFGAHDPAAIGPALKLGQALLITAWLGSAMADAKAGRQRLATADFHACDLQPSDLADRPPLKPLTWFARLQGHRIEQLLREAAPLLGYLNYDGARVVKALMAASFRAANNVRIQPQLLLDPEDGILSESALRKMKRRYFLGLSVELPFETVPANGQGHH